MSVEQYLLGRTGLDTFFFDSIVNGLLTLMFELQRRILYFNRIAEHFGFQFDHITGNHFVYRNWTGKKFVIPVHNKKIKALYVRKFIKEQE